MGASVYIQGKVVAICGCNSFIVDLDEIYAESGFNRRETVVITDIPRIPFWTPRGVWLKRILKSTLIDRKVGLTIERRDESGKLCLDSSGFLSYKEKENMQE